MTPLVTIGIPCFNCERWLAECVESALRQSWPAKEIIVVDDGSSDRSPEILRRFGDAIQAVQAPHRGANHARNEILRRARGEWIQYLDADDFLLPEKIARQFGETKTGESCDVIYSPVLIEEDGDRKPGKLDMQFDLCALWLSWQLPQTGGCLWRKDTLVKLGGWNEAMPCCQEHELYFRAIKSDARFCFAPTPNAVYRRWSTQTLCRRDPRQLIEVRTRLIDEMRTWMKEQDEWKGAHEAVAGLTCFEMARMLAAFDLDAAGLYHRIRRQKHLIHLDGPAAQLHYKIAYHLLGFTGAEKLARMMRRVPLATTS